ncbi:monovalent cation:proton antiporter-2 (CPA2) family protein [Rhodospirillum centenum]|uniref:Glutathione-regulated potassium-efflux system protein KefB n=1 Tax=Rhodospirillum centenum (strain ATCC 51521 / SW) TaxID=414684 RepID=B6IQT6_RHOCS|nr:monovalent cation:proton antiporter-2 (CPA2) family protein [Rhodospirillum centenum]ACI97822.1 glutathione-regulated potassium-efflux system protein KefB [Rhodospirillum centenum SW]
MPNAAEHALPFVQEAILFLAASIVVVLVLSRLRISPVLGYLLAGLLIGPSGLALIGDVDKIRSFAELGVVFLLFIIGLELSVERLQALRRWVFGLGAAQVGLTAGLIGGIAWFWGNSPEASMVLGACLALSSTAVVVQLLVERGEVASATGRVTFAVLLFQDLAVVPVLVLVSVLSNPGDQPLLLALGLSLLKAVVAVTVILVIGRFTLGPLLRRVAATRSTEIFTATALLIVLAMGWATSLGGLSAALGAFLAGLVLAGSEFRHQIESDIQPFKGLLLGLFFLTVGMGIDLDLVMENVAWALVSVFGLIAIKAGLTTGLALAFGAPRDVAIRSGLLLGEGGEFAFVVVGAALSAHMLPPEIGQFMFAVVGLSMLLTPFLPTLADRIVSVLGPQKAEPAGPEPDVAEMSGHVIVNGFGRVGQTVAALLSEQQVPYVALDMNPELVRAMREKGYPIHYGDGSRPELLQKLGADNAAAVIVTLDQPAATERAVGAVRHHWPKLQVFARARDRARAAELAKLGVEGVVPETFESSLSLAKGALQALGVPTQAVEELVTRHRESGTTAD